MQGCRGAGGSATRRKRTVLPSPLSTYRHLPLTDPKFPLELLTYDRDWSHPSGPGRVDLGLLLSPKAKVLLHTHGWVLTGTRVLPVEMGGPS